MKLKEKLELCYHAEHTLKSKIKEVEIQFVMASITLDIEDISTWVIQLDTYLMALDRVQSMITDIENKIQPENCSNYKNNGGNCIPVSVSMGSRYIGDQNDSCLKCGKFEYIKE